MEYVTNKSVLNSLDEKIKDFENKVKFYSDFDISRVKYHKDFLDYLKSYKKDPEAEKVVNDSKFNENDAYRDAAMWLRYKYNIDLTKLDDTVTTRESKKENRIIKAIREDYLNKIGVFKVGGIYKNENDDKCKIISMSHEYPDVEEYDAIGDAEFFWKKYKHKKDWIYIAYRNYRDGNFYVDRTNINSIVIGI